MPIDTTPRVSVIVATYNRARLLAVAIESLARQTLKDFEVVVVDDGSTDETPRLCRAKSEEDGRFRTIRTNRLERSEARNIGLSMANAPWVAFLDDDDLLHPHALEKLLASASDTARLAVACLAYSFESTDPLLGPAEIVSNPDRFSLRSWPPPPIPSSLGLPDLLLRPLAPINAGLFRRAWLEKVGGFDPALQAAEDYHLWLRAALEGPIPLVAEVLALVRRHPRQTTHDLARMSRHTRIVIERVLREPAARSARVDGPQIRTRLAALAREEAYAELLAGRRKSAALAAMIGLRYRPTELKCWGYLALAPAPGLYRALRELRRTFRGPNSA